MNDETLCIGAVVVAILMLGGLAFLTWLDERDDAEDDAEEILNIQEGDEISVDYTGRFLGSGGELGPLFDTTIPEDARNDSIPKSYSFREKPTYDDMTFTVGSGQMIEGFDKGVLGMRVGETKYITIPPEKGYGKAKPELRLDIQSKKTIPLKETMDPDDFSRRFPRVDPSVEEGFTHPFWGWDVDVIGSDPEGVEIVHRPAYEDEYGNFPWNVTVTDISTSRNVITLTHNLEEIETGQSVDFLDIQIIYPDWADDAREANGGTDPEPGFVTSTGGIITVDFNKEVAGKTLVFKVTVNEITRE